jgi:hypothetical protein
MRPIHAILIAAGFAAAVCAIGMGVAQIADWLRARKERRNG